MKLNDRELEMGVAGTKNSWHQEFKVGGVSKSVLLPSKANFALYYYWGNKGAFYRGRGGVPMFEFYY